MHFVPRCHLDGDGNVEAEEIFQKYDTNGDGIFDKEEVAMIKVVVPQMACRVIDRALQVHGGAGVCQDFPLAEMYAHMRTLRIADGPDEVHIRTVARLELRKERRSKL